MRCRTINERICNIKGNEQEINKLVDEYKPFIASCTEKVVHRYVRYGEDDELSIALMAFVEAIDAYDIEKGSFLSFSASIIKRRIIDYYRKEKKHDNVVSINTYSDCENSEIDLTYEKSVCKYAQDEESKYRKMEIEEFKEELNKWGITFNDLVKESPRQKRTRKLSEMIVGYIISNPQVVRTILKKKYLPVSEIEKNLKIPRKKIERMRKYIISTVLVLTGDYDYLKGYCLRIRRGGARHEGNSC